MTDDATASTQRMFKATAVMASGTMISRLLGFVRVSLVAFVLGNGTLHADTLAFATQVPTSIYMLFAGGALNTVLVPQIVRAVQKDADGGEAFINRIMTAFLTAMLVITVIVTAFTPQVMSLFTSEKWRSPNLANDWSALVTMSYITMPQLFFLGAFFLVGQVLNAKDKFGPMMWAPIVNNVVSIAVLVLYLVIWGTAGTAPFTMQQQLLLAVSSTVGIVLQTAALIPFARKLGFRFRPRWDWRGHGLGHVVRIAKWAFGYVAVTQVMSIINDRLASTATAHALPGELAAGANVFLTSYLFFILPHSLITVSFATALMPYASRLAAVGDLAGVARETMRTMRLALTVAVPVTFGFLTLAVPTAALALGHGRGAQDSILVAWTLMCFAPGLIGYTIQFLCLRAYYALEDTRSAFIVQCGIVTVQALTAVAFVMAWEQPATVAPRLALAHAIAHTTGAVASFWWLRKKLPGLQVSEMLQQIVRLTLATLPAAAVAWAWSTWFAQIGGAGGAFVQLIGGGTLALGLFVVTANRMHIPEIGQTRDLLLRRRSSATSAATAGATSQDPGTTNAVTEPLAVVTDGAEVTDGETTLSIGPVSYPEPDEPMPDLIFPHPNAVTLRVGQVLDGRYLLDDVLAAFGPITSWRAFDQVLGRAVLIHVLTPNTEQTRTLIEEARRAAIATDARFLRVLDVVDLADEVECAYIVGEYVGGHTLSRVLSDRRLTPMQAAWIGHEVAESLATMHGLRLYHGRLTPDSVLITSTGTVKVITFQPWLVEKALATDPMAHDVASVGHLMYAGLTATWPGRPLCGIPAVSLTNPVSWEPAVAELLPEELSTLIDSLVHSRTSATATDVALDLAAIVGAYDGTSALMRLLDSQQAVPIVPTPAMSMSSPPTMDDTATIEGSPFTDTTSFTPIPPPPATPEPVDNDLHGVTTTSEPRRRWLWGLVSLFGLALLINLIRVGLPVGPPAAPPSSAPTAMVKVTEVLPFDPKADRGDAAENNLLLPYVVDSDLKTCWTSEVYHNRPDFGGLKKGVGVVLDLGAETKVSAIRVTVPNPGSVVQLRVPTKATDQAPMDTRDSWRTVTEIATETATVTLKPEAPVSTRFVLLYFTKLAKEGNDYTAGLCDVRVNP